MADKTNQPDYTNADYANAIEEMEPVRDVCDGSKAVRAKGQRYLPKYFAENQQAYDARLKIATLFPATARTWQGLVGMVFRREIKLSADVPELIRGTEAEGKTPAAEGHWENIDNAGTHGSVFAQQAFECAVRDGHSAIFVDMPPALAPGSTLADEKAANRRPYWIKYEKDQILLPIRTVVENGQLKLQQVRFKECSTEPEGEFGEVEVHRIRVLRRDWVADETGMRPRVIWQLYRKQKTDDGSEKYLFETEGQISLPEIPIAFVYTRKTGLGRSCPPLAEQVEQNLKHYRLESNHEKALVLCLPIPCAKGIDPQQTQIVVGTENLMRVPENGDFWFAEPAGTSFQPTSEEIDKTESRMARIGLSLLEPKAPQPTTATQNLLDHVKEESELATWVKSLADAIERCLGFHAAYLGLPSGGSVEITSTLERLTIPPEKLRSLSEMVANKQLSLETLWEILNRAGELPESFDPKTEKDAIEANAELMADRMLSAFESGDGGRAATPDKEDDATEP